MPCAIQTIQLCIDRDRRLRARNSQVEVDRFQTSHSTSTQNISQSTKVRRRSGAALPKGGIMTARGLTPFNSAEKIPPSSSRHELYVVR